MSLSLRYTTDFLDLTKPIENLSIADKVIRVSWIHSWIFVWHLSWPFFLSISFHFNFISGFVNKSNNSGFVNKRIHFERKNGICSIFWMNFVSHDLSESNLYRSSKRLTYQIIFSVRMLKLCHLIFYIKLNKWRGTMMKTDKKNVLNELIHSSKSESHAVIVNWN